MDVFFQYVVNGVVGGSVYVLVALGLALIFGAMHIPDLSHGESYMLGAFVSFAVAATGVPFVLAAVAGVAAGALVGAAKYHVAFKPVERSGLLPQFIAAFAASTILAQLATIIWGLDPRVGTPPLSGVLEIAGISIRTYELVVVILVILAAIGLKVVLDTTQWGRSIRALEQNDMLARTLGINHRWTATTTFAVAGGLGALAGVLLGVLNPIYPLMGFIPVLKAFVVIVIGGRGSIVGMVIAGFGLGVVEALVTGYVGGEYRDVVAFALLAVVLTIRPTGLRGVEVARA